MAPIITSTDASLLVRVKHFRLLWLVAAGFAVLVPAGSVKGGNCTLATLTDGPLETLRGTIEFDVHYLEGACGDGLMTCTDGANDSNPCNDNTDCPGGTCNLDTIPLARAQDVQRVLGEVYDKFVGQFGFRTPYVTGLPEFNVLICGNGDAGSSSSAGITISTDRFQCSPTDLEIRRNTAHEFFHNIERAYLCDVSGCGGSLGPIFGTWVSEGIDVCVDDRLYLDLDGANFDSPGDTFWSRVTEVPGPISTPETSLVDMDYKACLFWSYCCEQFGIELGKPEMGIDFVRTFWEQVTLNAGTGTVAGLDAAEDAIQSYPAGAGRTLLDTIVDYAICNYTHLLDATALPNPGRYLYLDELPGGGGGSNYGSVAPTAVGIPSSGIDAVDRYAIRYFQGNVPAGTLCQGVGFRGASDVSGSLDDVQPRGWALLGVTVDNRATLLSKAQGLDFARTFIVSPSDPIRKLGAVVVGLDQYDDFEYWFDSGPLSVQIIRPTSAQPQYPGPSGVPGRFVARVLVEGPEALKPLGEGPRSVKGLHPADFTARVDAIDAEVLTGIYDGGYYLLELMATVPADGLYDLSIALCDGVTSDTNADSVYFGNFTINHVVVIDRSGSMAHPVGNSKIATAMEAAGLYVDAVADTNRIGVVAFSGDGNDVPACDNDTSFYPGAGGLVPANALNRAAAVGFINGLAASGNTSIGDGLWQAQDQLDDFPPPAVDLNLITLLSDGVQNESRYWDVAAGACASAASLIVPTDTVINTIPYGPQADQDLMQTIAEDTEGDPLPYVDVEAAAVTAGPTSSPLNRLADVYMDSIQRFRRFERLFFSSGSMGAGFVDVNIPVTEVGVQPALFFFNASDPSANLSVELFDHTGAAVTPPVAVLYDRSGHVVYHLNGLVSPGNWRARLTVTAPVDYIAGLLGRQRLGTHLRLRTSQIDPGHICTGVDEGRFKQGVPVTIQVVLSDANGPIRDALVEARIEKPDGSTTCEPRRLRDDGTQDDGEPDDGVYGWIFTETRQASRGGINWDDPINPPPPGARGTYNVRVSATGTNHSLESFTRSYSSSFQVTTAQCDPDLDTLPDSWERHYGTDPFAADAGADADDDALSNLKEFRFGTHPFDSDTDGDGEEDGSEVFHGRCPTNPSDSPLKSPTDAQVIVDAGDEGPIEIPGAILLRFPWRAAYAQMRIYRAVDAPVGFALLTTVVPTKPMPMPVNYPDAAVEPGRTYYYRFQAVGHDGGETSLSGIVHGIVEVPPLPVIAWDGDPLSPDRVTRALRFRVDAPVTATGTPGQTAIKVTMIDLQNPIPPNLPSSPPPDFSGYESATCTATGEMNGCARWVGKPGTFLEAQDVPLGAFYRAARLQCTPFYYDWITETVSGPIAVVGGEIAPSSMYIVQAYSASCKGGEATCTNVSAPVTMLTRRSGDVEVPFVPPATSGQPDVTDIAQLVNKFKNVAGAPVKEVAQLQPNLPELNADISALDIVAVVDAVKERAYAFGGPCPCPSTVTCASTPCSTSATCVSSFGPEALCVKTCTSGTNAGDPCINNTHCPGGVCGAGFCRDRCGRCN